MQLSDYPPHPVHISTHPNVDAAAALIRELRKIENFWQAPLPVWTNEIRRTMDKYNMRLTWLLFWKENHEKPWDFLAIAAESFMKERNIQTLRELLRLAH